MGELGEVEKSFAAAMWISFRDQIVHSADLPGIRCIAYDKGLNKHLSGSGEQKWPDRFDFLKGKPSRLSQVSDVRKDLNICSGQPPDNGK